jgi:hypothetical protein
VQVLIRRSQYESFWGTIYYVLDARIDPSPAEADLIATHSVGEIIVFDSEQRKQRLEKAQAHAEALSEQPILPKGNTTEDIFLSTLSTIGSTLFGLGGATYNLIAASLDVRVTFDDLISGAHLESEHSTEILDAENIIRHSIEALQAHLANLHTFDGRDEFYETE